MINSKKVYSILEYLLIIALFYVTGGAFSYINYSLQITIFFIFSLILCIFYKKKILGHKNALLSLTLASFFVILPGVLFDFNSVTSYIAIIMQLAIGYFCACFIDINNFKKKFVNVITIFALISLIGFYIGLVNPSIALRFPLIDNIDGASVNYYNAFVYIFMSSKGYSGLHLTTRNAGICWEPGCYQMFLNLAIVFLFDLNKTVKEKKFFIKLAILIITIITTVSTTGYFLLILIILINLKYIAKRKNLLLVILILLIVSFFVLNEFSFGNDFVEKVKNEFIFTDSSKQTFFSRLSLDTIKYVFTDSFFVGMGFTKWLSFEQSLWNSIIHSFLVLGTPFTILHITNIYKGSKRIMSTNHVLLFAVIIVSACTETLFWRVLFNTISFYGLNYNNQRRDKYEYFIP